MAEDAGKFWYYRACKDVHRVNKFLWRVEYLYTQELTVESINFISNNDVYKK